MKGALLLLMMMIPLFGISQKSYKKIGRKKTEKLLQKFKNEGNFDTENYYSIYQYRDSIKEEFLPYSIVWYSGDTLVLGIDEYKPKNRRNEIAELYFNSKYFNTYTCFILIFGSSLTRVNDEGLHIRESFTPYWTYIKK